MHTPEQAKELWCPMRREKPQIMVAPHSQEVIEVQIPTSCRCIADQCAMWRWAYATELRQSERASTLANVRTGEGFCGIGGRPEVAA